MRLSALALISLLVTAPAFAQDKAAEKSNANPCGEEVAAALQKLRNSSWFRMESRMITENGLTDMTVDYVLPDRMHQKVTVVGQPVTQQVILIGEQSWSNEGEGWRALPKDITDQLVTQMKDNVLTEQKEVGKYSCKGRVQLEGKDVLSYKLEDEPPEDSKGTKNEAYRMFYVDSVTGLPVLNAIVSPGREDKPLFKTSYSFPIDLKIDAPKDARPVETQAPAAEAAPAAPAADAAPAAPAPEAPK
jgi:hypothetical protein